MFSDDFFTRVALPLYNRHQESPDSEELLWASVVSLNHVLDYQKRNRATIARDSPIDRLKAIANAFKHAKPERHAADRRQKSGLGKPETSGSGERVHPGSTSNSLFLVPNIFAEPNIFASWTVEIDGERCSIGPVLKSVIEFWSNEFGRGNEPQG
jgi:hypothetical protein